MTRLTAPRARRRAPAGAAPGRSGEAVAVEGAGGRDRMRLAGRWLLSSLAYPPAGLAAIAVVSAVDRPSAALLGGAIVGAGIGVGQWLALRATAPGRDLLIRWVSATVIGMALGLAAGAAAVGYATTMSALVAMGLITGAVLGPAQALVLRTTHLATTTTAAVWALTVPALWALGWFVTTVAGIDVERAYAVFGLSGAVTSATVGGLVISRIVDRRDPG